MYVTQWYTTGVRIELVECVADVIDIGTRNCLDHQLKVSNTCQKRCERYLHVLCN